MLGSVNHERANHDWWPYGLNGRRLTLTNDEAYDLVMSVAEGRLDTVESIAAALTTQPHR
jgi:prophage maintenance system killer protein